VARLTQHATARPAPGWQPLQAQRQWRRRRQLQRHRPLKQIALALPPARHGGGHGGARGGRHLPGPAAASVAAASVAAAAAAAAEAAAAGGARGQLPPAPHPGPPRASAAAAGARQPRRAASAPPLRPRSRGPQAAAAASGGRAPTTAAGPGLDQSLRRRRSRARAQGVATRRHGTRGRRDQCGASCPHTRGGRCGLRERRGKGRCVRVSDWRAGDIAECPGHACARTSLAPQAWRPTAYTHRTAAA
jgi:hypothetical protein